MILAFNKPSYRESVSSLALLLITIITIAVVFLVVVWLLSLFVSENKLN